ncbi:TauD-domain-containing protein [Jaminaea rosea]|uniref:TauD-domain-containing protein n=1 Tax=Jaminaea rosea TaxID=1569628 RepID=A0A316UU01_9BASI|nr:TauD-domain-containing protein [Jaminaea rosea]PWN28786.1 TauD-domain-containing protein [Jaminaea rosea]
MVSVSPPPRYSAGSYGVDAEKPLGAGSAPARAVNPTQPKTQPPKGATDEKKSTIKEYNPYHNPFSAEDTEADKLYPYPHLKPCFPTDISTPEYQPIHNVVDRGSFADPAKRHLLSVVDKVDNLSVHIGTELSGFQVKDLTPAQKDDLALLVAERGVVVLRDQDLGADELVNFGRYFGASERPLHQHPSSGVPRARKLNGTSLDEVHTIWHDENMRPTGTLYTSTELWHSDVTFEKNPPGFTALYNITNPVHGGGDTLFSSCYGLYDALSPSMQEYLETLTALHSGTEQAEGASKAGLHLRRPAVETEHPLVRTHPVTGWKSIFANPAFTRHIVGVPKVESDAILNMLYSIMNVDPNLTLRVRWQKNTLVLWNNAVVNHAATFDHWRPDPSCRRHALRVASTGEIPSTTLPDGRPGRSRQEAIWEQEGFDVEALKARGRKNIKNTGFKD